MPVAKIPTQSVGPSVAWYQANANPRGAGIPRVKKTTKKVLMSPKVQKVKGGKMMTPAQYKASSHLMR